MRDRDFKVGDQVYVTKNDALWFRLGRLTWDAENMRSVEVGTIVGRTNNPYEVKFWALPDASFLFYNYEMIHANL